MRRTPIGSTVVACGIALVLDATLAVAQPATLSAQHLRPEPGLRALVADAVHRSPTVRDLVARLEGSNVIVYIRARPFAGTTLRGRVGLLSHTTRQRFLVIELACGRIWDEQIATLGHELRHAVEIAETPSVVDTRTLIDHYRRIGVRTSGELSPTSTFETEPAIQTGRQVWRELVAPRRSADGS